MKQNPPSKGNRKKTKTVLRLPGLEHGKATGPQLSGGLVGCERAHYGTRMTVRIANVELFARM
jgi:hypothetical protein